MKKLLVTLLCIGALIGLPGCGGCCKQSCDSNYYDENRMECHDEMQSDGTMKRVCSDGNIVTVYGGVTGKKGKSSNAKEVRHEKTRLVNPYVEGEQVKVCDPNLQVWKEVGVMEEGEPQKRAPRSRRPASRRMQNDMMMEEMEME